MNQQSTSVRRKVFAWLPVHAYSSRYYRDGFRWLSFVWLGDDGQHYTRSKP